MSRFRYQLAADQSPVFSAKVSVKFVIHFGVFSTIQVTTDGQPKSAQVNTILTRRVLET